MGKSRGGFAFLGLWLCCAGALPAAELLPAETPIAAAIDHYIDARLKQEGLTPAPPAADEVLARRTTLDLVGRPATVAEVQAFLDAGEGRREELVRSLMDSPEFLPHQVTEFDTMLMYGSGGSLREYLQEALTENRPWDVMFRELMVAADGPSSAFLRARVEDLDKLTVQASVAFFGVNISCAKCHDHPMVGDWTQDRFYGMKSFFSRTFENGGFLGERDYGYVKFETTEGEQKQAPLMFFTGLVVDEPETDEPSSAEKKAEKKRLEELKKKKEPPPPASFSRRRQLVEVALQEQNRHYLARAIANRLWARFYGRGLVDPVDQMHPQNEPSHPRLLDWLARDLVDHEFDLRRLIAGLVSSEAYARSSRWEQPSDAPYPEYFAVAAMRPLTPHQYAAALRLGSIDQRRLAMDEATDLEEVQQRLQQLHHSARGLAGLFDQPQGDFQVSVTEALLMSNSERIQKELLGDSGDSLVARLTELDDPRERAETAVWNVLGASPSDQQRAALAEYFQQRQDEPLEAARQVVWALLCSSHCRFNY